MGPSGKDMGIKLWKRGGCHTKSLGPHPGRKGRRQGGLFSSRSDLAVSNTRGGASACKEKRTEREKSHIGFEMRLRNTLDGGIHRLDALRILHVGWPAFKKEAERSRGDRGYYSET